MALGGFDGGGVVGEGCACEGFSKTLDLLGPWDSLFKGLAAWYIVVHIAKGIRT